MVNLTHVSPFGSSRWNRVESSFASAFVRFFLGGHFVTPGCSFHHWFCLSPLHVWIDQELVRLIALITPVKFLINMIHAKSLKKILGDFLINCREKMLIFGSYKACISNFAYTSLATTKNQYFFTTIDQKAAQEIFSGTSHVSYWSKTWRVWSGLSIAQILYRFTRVEATNDANEERSNPVSRSVPLKKKRTFLRGKIAKGGFDKILIFSSNIRRLRTAPGSSLWPGSRKFIFWS